MCTLRTAYLLTSNKGDINGWKELKLIFSDNVSGVAEDIGSENHAEKHHTIAA